MVDELGHTPIVRRREDVYELLFGRYDTVYHSPADVHPRIDAYVHPPTTDRDFFTLVTGGMSDTEMSAPPGAPRRAELVTYTDSKPRMQLAQKIVGLAAMPRDQDTWLGWGHSSDCGPIAPSSKLEVLLLLTPPLEPDALLGSYLEIEAEPVDLFWAFPITAAERDYKAERGTAALMSLFTDGVQMTVEHFRADVTT
jgi:hypothetical protein